MTTPPAVRLSTLLPLWWELLQVWAVNGQLQEAAIQALRLDEPPEALLQLNSRLAAGEQADLPRVELLTAEAMGGALGAYASGISTIYLNADWLLSGDERSVQAVLTEELGHHLDALLNQADTPGDEGAMFAQLLLGGELSAEQLDLLAAENDWGVARVNGQEVAVEMANFTGTEGGDVLTGTVGDDSIRGLGGNDLINAGSGNDSIDAGLGVDSVDGGADTDLLIVDYSSNTYSVSREALNNPLAAAEGSPEARRPHEVIDWTSGCSELP
jgi:hypothetical protein